MTAAVVDSTHRTVAARRTGRSLGWWGMVWTIATEGVLFGLLLFAYFFIRANSPRWPQGDIAEPELALSAVQTAILLGSSIPAHIAHRAAQRGDRRATARGLAAAWVMGATFLVMHGYELRAELSEFRADDNAYATLWYSITNLHALHLCVGLVIFAFLFLRTLSRQEPQGERVEVGILYWHFVDVVWVFVYSSLYLSVAL